MLIRKYKEEYEKTFIFLIQNLYYKSLLQYIRLWLEEKILTSLPEYVMGVLYPRNGIEKNDHSLSLRRNQLSIKCAIYSSIQQSRV